MEQAYLDLKEFWVSYWTEKEHNILPTAEKTDDIWRRHQQFLREMTAEKRAQKFHNDDALLPISG